MKKVITVILIAVLALAASSCSGVIYRSTDKTVESTGPECDLCGKKGAYNRAGESEKWRLCDTCYEEFGEELADEDKASKEYANICGVCGKTVNGTDPWHDECLGIGICEKCGKSIPEDKLYCDECLGAGTCLNCGVAVSDGRTYCDACLGRNVCIDCGKNIDDDGFYCDACLLEY